MSKNFPTDNIYSILGKLQALQPTPQERHDANVQQIRESVEAQGSILKGLREVSATEAKLRQQFAEGEKWIQKAVNPEHKGDLHKALHVAQDKKIPAGKIEKAAHSKNAHLRQMAQFAKNVAHEGADMEEQNMGPGTGGMEEDYASMGTGFGTGGGVVGEETIDEKAPPGMEAMVRKLKKEYPSEPAKAFATAWSIYNKKHGQADESREACAECAMHEDPMGGQEGGTVAEQGKVHRGTYGTSYYKGADYDDEKSYRADQDEPEAKSKVPAEKKGRGRPTKASTGELTSQARMPWGGKPPKIDANPTKKWPKTSTTVHKIAESVASVESRLLEGLNFRRMAEETSQSLDELMNELQQDITNYKSTGHCSEKLKDFLTVHSHSKKQMEEETAMETAAKGIGHDLVTPAERVAQATPAKPGIMGAVKDVARGAKNWIQGKPETGPTYEEADPLEQELNELAKLAGLTVADEGNAFTGKLKSTPQGGKFDLDGKEYTDTSTLDEEPNEGNEFSGKLAQARAQHKDSFDVDGKEYEVKEADAPVDEPIEEPANNAHRTEYKTMRQSTMNPGEGDPGEKAMHPNRPTFKNGDNALSKPAMAEAIDTLEARLSAEYESIKKVSR